MKKYTREQAWQEVNRIFPTDYEKDHASSERAGYDIYRHHELNYYNRICDLGSRIEVLLGEYGENVTNLWIEEPSAETSLANGDAYIASLRHKIFLTKSHEAAFALSRAFEIGYFGSGTRITSVGSGPAHMNPMIPSIYHNKGFFYCAIATEHESNDAGLEIIIC